MEAGCLMGRPKRHTRTKSASSPEALAALLPDELRSLGGPYTPSDYLSLRGHVVDWLEQDAPGAGQELATAVMTAAGLSVADYYRKALT